MNNAEPIVEMKTNMGTIELQLDAKAAPATVENFLAYVNSGFYKDTIFHRVIKDFMIQGGGFSENMIQKETKASIKNEADNGLKNEKYTIAMARTNIPDSATSQFFINTKDNSFLNFSSKTTQGWGYAVFGKVIKGQDVVDKINAVATGTKRGMQDVPAVPVIIEKMTEVKAEPKTQSAK
jgi:peptidyl-prolyl cis-trans isomerase B (cyclophilin B)